MNSKETTKKYIQEIKSTKITERDKLDVIAINHNFIDGAFVEIAGNKSEEIYEVSFYDEDKGGELIHKSNIKRGHWTRTNRKYYTNWRIEVKKESGELIFSERTNPKNKKVYISLDSSSIGDSVAWIPYIEEFKKKHDCEVIVSTFWNHLFEDSYPNIEFVKPGDVVKNIYAMYKLGCFYNSDLEPEQCNTIPLQKVATNILGLEFKEIMTKIDFNKKERKIKEKYVTIATHSTAQIKYWNNPTGWQETVNYLIKEGYTVVNTSREGCSLKGVLNLDDYSIDNILNTIHYSDFFIGLSSGISWLAWSLKKTVVLIANFTNEEHEFQENCIRITNKSACHGCWNKKEHIFDKGDWNWCPIYKGTDRQFECSKSITGNMVINKIKEII